MIAEQIASKFNPVYNLYINEIPLQTEPTVVPLSLESVNLTNQEYDEFSSNIVTIECEFILKGNIYPPITDQAVVNKIEIFNGNWEGNEYERVSKIIWEKQLDETFGSSLISFDGKVGKIKPVINDIVGPSNVIVNSTSSFVVDYADTDNKFSELTFFWNIIPGVGHVASEYGVLSVNKNVCSFLAKSFVGSCRLQCFIIDIHGNQSESFYKDISIA